MTAMPWKKNEDTTEVVYLTPEDAREFLKRNTNNRNIVRRHVERLRSDMIEGRWQYNASPIKFNHDLELLDGQHRLTALSECPEGTTIKFLVAYGIDTLARRTMDIGKTRSAADALVLDSTVKSTNATNVAAAVRIYIPWMAGTLFTRNNGMVSTPEVLQWCDNHPDEVKLLDHIGSISGLKRLNMRPAIATAVAMHLFLVNALDAQTFVDALTHGTNLGEGHPVLALRNRLDRLRNDKKRVSDPEYIAMMVWAWNAYRDGRKIGKIQPPNGGWNSSNFPVAK